MMEDIASSRLSNQLISPHHRRVFEMAGLNWRNTNPAYSPLSTHLPRLEPINGPDQRVTTTVTVNCWSGQLDLAIASHVVAPLAASTACPAVIARNSAV